MIGCFRIASKYMSMFVFELSYIRVYKLYEINMTNANLTLKWLIYIIVSCSITL